MTPSEDRQNNLHDVLFDMESDVRDMTRWATTINHLAQSDNDPSECMLVIGPAMEEIAERIERAWERAHDLSSKRQGGAR